MTPHAGVSSRAAFDRNWNLVGALKSSLGGLRTERLTETRDVASSTEDGHEEMTYGLTFLRRDSRAGCDLAKTRGWKDGTSILFVERDETKTLVKSWRNRVK